MATVVSWNGSSFTIPATGEENWGGVTKVDGFLVSVAQNSLQKTGGTFTLSADVDWGSAAGHKAAYYKSRGTVSTAGIIRLAKTESIGWLNNAGSGNNLLTTDTSDNLTWNGTIIASSAGVVPVASGGTNITSYTIGDILYASGATTLSKRAIGAANTVLYSNGTAPAWQLILNANIDGSAAIAYSKLALTGAIVNGDLAGSITAAKLVATDIVTVGTITTGVWSGTAITAAKGGTGQTSYTTGDLPYASGAAAISKLGIGSTGQVLKVAAGLPSWGSAGAALATGAKTGNYTILSTDDALSGDSSGGAFTFTLPDCATNAGKVYYLKKIDSSFTAITIARAGADTIQDFTTAATSTTLDTQGELIMIASFGGTVWQILNRHIPSVWTAYTATVGGITGGTNNVVGFWKREGDSVRCKIENTSNPIFTGGSAPTFTIPNSGVWTIATAKIPSGTGTDSLLGFGLAEDVGTQDYLAGVYYASTTTVKLRMFVQGGGAGSVYLSCANDITTTLPFVWAGGDRMELEFVVPITGLNG